MATTEIAIALKFIAKNTTNPELKKISDGLGGTYQAVSPKLNNSLFIAF